MSATIKKKDINSTKKRFSCKDCRVIGNRNEIHARKTIIHGRRNIVKGHDNEIHGDRNRVFGIRSTIYGDRNKVYGFRATVVGNGNIIYGNYATVTGQDNVIKGNNCIVNGVVMSASALVPTEADESLDRLALENESVCTICLENVSNCAIFPCRHQCVCVKCSRTMNIGDESWFKCPVCRGSIVSIISFYK